MSLPSRSFGSVAVAMVTPMNPDGSVDYASSRRLAAQLVADGCDAIVLAGTTGESTTTHTPEKDEVIRVVVDEIGGKAMIIAGAGSNDTAHATRIPTPAGTARAGGLLGVAPYHN